MQPIAIGGRQHEDPAFGEELARASEQPVGMRHVLDHFAEQDNVKASWPKREKLEARVHARDDPCLLLHSKVLQKGGLQI